MSTRILRTRAAGGIAFCGVIVFAAAAARPASAAADEPAEALYEAQCSRCHASHGSGNTPIGKSLKVADLRSPATQAKTDAQLGESILQGKGKMTPFRGKLSQDEVTALVAYVRALAKPKA